MIFIFIVKFDIYFLCNTYTYYLVHWMTQFKQRFHITIFLHCFHKCKHAESRVLGMDVLGWVCANARLLYNIKPTNITLNYISCSVSIIRNQYEILGK